MLSPCRLLHASNRRLSTILHTRKLSQTLYQRAADAVTYRWIEDVEELERYQPGGYHPVSIGDVLAGRYQIEHKLGHGGFSTIWLARDIRYKKGYVALKINTADSSSQESEVLLALAQSDHPCRAMIPLIRDQFELEGPNGSHRCFVTSPARCSLDDAQDSDGFPLETARVLVAQSLMVVAYIHSRGFVHGDIHPGNILLRLPSTFDELSVGQLNAKFGQPHKEKVVRTDGMPLPSNVPPFGVVPVWIGKRADMVTPSEARLLLNDFGEAFLESQRRPGRECRSPLIFRPPETWFEPERPLSYSSDIWSLACSIWPMLGLRSLFSSCLATRDDILSQHVDTLGLPSFPSSWWNEWETRHDYFEPGLGQLSTFDHPLERAFEEKIQAWRQRVRMGEFDQDEATAILAMLRGMLVFAPDERATAKSLLAS
ncbi:hypothetical protein MferCBS31731_004088 [Microsporum ferrugineum]